MKAIRVHEFGGPEVLKLEEVPDLQPGQGEVVVRVHAAGVNPGGELMFAPGPMPRNPPFLTHQERMPAA